MSDQTINAEQNKKAEQWRKEKPFVAGAFILLCLYSIFVGMPNPPLAVFFGLLATYTIRS